MRNGKCGIGNASFEHGGREGGNLKIETFNAQRLGVDLDWEDKTIGFGFDRSFAKRLVRVWNRQAQHKHADEQKRKLPSGEWTGAA